LNVTDRQTDRQTDRPTAGRTEAYCGITALSAVRSIAR